MRLSTLCVVWSVLVVVSSASPVKTGTRDESVSSESAESSELKISLSGEAEKETLNIKDKTNEEDNSIDSSEEQSDQKTIIKEDTSESTSAEEDGENFNKYKRAVDFAPHNNNQLTVKDKKSGKTRSLRNAEESDEPKDSPHKVLRQGPSPDTSKEGSSEESHASHAGHEYCRVKKPNTKTADTSELANKPNIAPAESDPKPEHSRRKRNTSSENSSEEKSSEEEQKNKNHDAAQEHSVDVAKKPDTAPAETISLAAKPDAAPAEGEAKSEGSRRRRHTEISREADLLQDQDANDVFIFSSEQLQDSEESFKHDHLKSNEYFLLNKIKNREKSEISLENKNSEEDYAQGCGGGNGDQDSSSNETSNENNDAIIDKL